MTVTDELSAELRGYLQYCGLSKKKIAQCSSSTRLYHDLGIYGEIAEGYMEVLVDCYRVDLSGFYFNEFFPCEYAVVGWLSLLPFAEEIARRRQRREYLPLTLEMIENVIRTRQWKTVEQAAK